MMKYIASVLFAVVVSVGLLAALGTPAALFASADAGEQIDVWWPTNGAHVSGVQPFKAMLDDADASQYQMFWQVDGGSLVAMSDNATDYPHKEASVDLSGWNWHGSGPYTVNFVAKENGATVGQQSIQIYVDGSGSSSDAPANNANAAPAASSSPNAASSTSPSASPSASSSPASAMPAPQSPVSIDVWWPTPGAALQGVQPFKAAVPGRSPDSYLMFWKVGNGNLVEMQDNDTDSPHKEASVDLSGWGWEKSGNYTITFVAQGLSGNTLGTASEQIIVHPGSGNSDAAPVSVNTLQTFAANTAASSSSSLNTETDSTINGMKLYVDPNSSAAAQARAWQQSNPSGAAAMQTLANEPTAVWFGDWNSNIQNDVHSVVSAAQSQGATPVLVAYDIPERDCGSYSSGGASASGAYQSWIQSFAAGIGSSPAIVILEPDSLAEISCLSSQDKTTRLSLLSGAVATLKSNPSTKVYIDAGHSNWIDANTMASLLKQAGIGQADGFSLNVSNFNATQDEVTYGAQLSGLVGGKHFVVDTSRNGLGSNGLWCNPPGRAIGQKPTTDTGNSLVDAYLWIKTPGESDGSCNGGPSAGQWWPEYALGLVSNAQ